MLRREGDALDYRILGPLEVFDDGEAIDIGTPQQRALLANLLLQANRVVATEQILEGLWPSDPVGKEATLWVYISRLRSILDPDREGHRKSSVLVTHDHGYSLVVGPDEVDAHRFEELAQQGSELLRDDPAAAADVLRSALSLWRGAALEDFTYDDFAQFDASRLEDLRLTALEDRLEADIRGGNHRKAVGELDQLVTKHPHRERFVGQQMIALYRSGRPADALRSMERHCKTIGEELGIEPSPELRRIEEQVLLHDQRLAEPPSGREGLVSDVNPFIGLHAFTEDDADRFFGRDPLVEELVDRITAGHRLLALVGASGSGKSSVLHAGLVPAVRRGLAGEDHNWLIATMVPGSHPFREAEAALAGAAPDSSGEFVELLGDSEDGLLRASIGLLADSERLLLVIDQFEELFTLGTLRVERDCFVRNLEVVLDDPSGRVVVALGLRADFYGHPLEYAAFAQMLADGIANVVPLTTDELASAAEKPAAHAGTTLERPLLVQLLSDVAGEAGGLPLFQYTLTELFDQREGAILTLDAYEDMGGVSGAIARRAEDLFLALDVDERDAVKQLFLRLVTTTEHGAWGRRRVSAGEITTISSDLVPLQTVVERFASHRLLTLDLDPVSGSPAVEVAHEALLHQWPRLRRWIEAGQKDVLAHARLEIALREWEASGGQTDYLLSGRRLTDYEGWAALSTLRLSRIEERFLEESIHQREAERVAEQERLAREVKLDLTAKRRLWALAALGLPVIAGLAASVLFISSSAAPTIAVVHGAAGDLGISDMMIAGVGDVERARDIEVDLVEPLVDAEEDLRRLAEAGTDLIIVTSEFDVEVDAIAQDYPDVHWVAIDPAAVHLDQTNVSEMHFEVEDSAFMAGAAAALSTGSGKVGFIGGYQTFRSERSRNGFERGAFWINPEIEVVSMFLGPVVDPGIRAELSDDLAYDLARSMYASGVDLIFHDTGSAGTGVIEAAVDWSGTNDQVWTIGSDADEYLTLPATTRGVVLSSTIKRFDTAVELAIDGFLDSDLPAGDTLLGLADNGVGLSRSGGQLAAIDGLLTNLEGDLEFEHITVSPHAARPPVWQRPADVSIELSQMNGVCTIDRITIAGVAMPNGDIGEVLPVTRDSVVEIHLSNEGSDIAGLVLSTIPVGTTVADLTEEARSAAGPAESLERIQALTTAQLGGRTAVAAVVSESPLAINCVRGVPSLDSTYSYPLIVIPS